SAILHGEVSESRKRRSAYPRDRARPKDQGRHRDRNRSGLRPNRGGGPKCRRRNEIDQRQSKWLAAFLLPAEKVFRARNPERGTSFARRHHEDFCHDRFTESDPGKLRRALCRYADRFQILRGKAGEIRARVAGRDPKEISANARGGNPRRAPEI